MSPEGHHCSRGCPRSTGAHRLMPVPFLWAHVWQAVRWGDASADACGPQEHQVKVPCALVASRRSVVGLRRPTLTAPALQGLLLVSSWRSLLFLRETQVPAPAVHLLQLSPHAVRAVETVFPDGHLSVICQVGQLAFWGSLPALQIRQHTHVCPRGVGAACGCVRSGAVRDGHAARWACQLLHPCLVMFPSRILWQICFRSGTVYGQEGCRWPDAPGDIAPAGGMRPQSGSGARYQGQQVCFVGRQLAVFSHAHAHTALNPGPHALEPSRCRKAKRRRLLLCLRRQQPRQRSQGCAQRRNTCSLFVTVRNYLLDEATSAPSCIARFHLRCPKE